MKRMFKVAAIVAVASLALVACKNNKEAEEPIVDDTTIQLCADDMTVDTLVEDTVTVAEEATPVATKKTTTKKAENKPAEAGVAATNDNASKKVVETKDADEITTTNTVKRTGRR